MNIAICDNDYSFINYIEEYTRRTLEIIDAPFKIFTYSSGEDAVDAIFNRGIGVDIILLDIDMDRLSGFEVAKRIREYNDRILIIFVSSYEKYVFKSFEFSPFRFIRKNVIDEELEDALKEAYKVYKKNKRKYILFEGDNGQYKIEMNEIVYFKTERRKVYMYLDKDKVVGINKNIRELVKELDAEQFAKIDSGCIVNIKYIKNYTKLDVVLDDDTVIPISRNGMKELKIKIEKYWRNFI